MNTRNKISLISLFFFFICALGLGIYLFPDNDPMVVEKIDTPQKQGSLPQSEKTDPKAVLRKAPPTGLPPAAHSEIALQTDSIEPEDNLYISYPETLVELLGIDMDELIEARDAFKNTIIHVSWMDRVNDILKNIDPDKKEAIIKNHTSLLYIKDKLNEAYLTGKIDFETFKTALAELMKWHQKTYQSILSNAEYEALFEIEAEAADDTIDELVGATPEYSFILNQQIAPEDVKDLVQGYKLEEVNSHFKKMVLDRDIIGKQINSGKVTLEQARAELIQSEQTFIAQCKETLTEDEINTIFGSVKALETGATQEEAPAVLGDTDEIELGFKIENPETSIEHVTNSIDKEKIGDIRFFYQQRAQERDELLNELDSGGITPEELENISREMDSVYEENCRDTLSDEEYKLIFKTQAISETEHIDNKAMDTTLNEKDTESGNPL